MILNLVLTSEYWVCSRRLSSLYLDLMAWFWYSCSSTSSRDRVELLPDKGLKLWLFLDDMNEICLGTPGIET